MFFFFFLLFLFAALTHTAGPDTPCEGIVTVSCECDRRQARAPCSMRHGAVLTCDDECRSISRQAQLARAFGYIGGDDGNGGGGSGNAKPLYSADLVDYARARPATVRRLERELLNFVLAASQPKKREIVDPLTKDERLAVYGEFRFFSSWVDAGLIVAATSHEPRAWSLSDTPSPTISVSLSPSLSELSRYYGIGTEANGQDPHRRVTLVRRSTAAVPSLSLGEAVFPDVPEARRLYNGGVLVRITAEPSSPLADAACRGEIVERLEDAGIDMDGVDVSYISGELGADGHAVRRSAIVRLLAPGDDAKAWRASVITGESMVTRQRRSTKDMSTMWTHMVVSHVHTL